MHKRLSYANVAATLALVFSMSGGAWAASHYLINSTKQINPKVLKALTGKAGATGKEGPQGKEGTQGKEGPQGKEGKEGVAGSAVAYAHITPVSEPKAILDTANSKNVSAVTEVEAGIYCISTTVPVQNGVGSADPAFESAHPTVVEVNFSVVAEVIALKRCPASTTVIAATASTTGTFEKADFWIAFN